jgi:hypothetical protein
MRISISGARRGLLTVGHGAQGWDGNAKRPSPHIRDTDSEPLLFWPLSDTMTGYRPTGQGASEHSMVDEFTIATPVHSNEPANVGVGVSVSHLWRRVSAINGKWLTCPYHGNNISRVDRQVTAENLKAVGALSISHSK